MHLQMNLVNQAPAGRGETIDRTPQSLVKRTTNFFKSAVREKTPRHQKECDVATELALALTPDRRSGLHGRR